MLYCFMFVIKIYIAYDIAVVNNMRRIMNLVFIRSMTKVIGSEPLGYLIRFTFNTLFILISIHITNKVTSSFISTHGHVEYITNKGNCLCKWQRARVLR